jgi:hypothetical protein
MNIAVNYHGQELMLRKGIYRKLDQIIQRLIAAQSNIELVKYVNEVVTDMSL